MLKADLAVVAVNLSGSPAQGWVAIPAEALCSESLTFLDVFTGMRYERDVEELRGAGLFVDLPAWGYHVLVAEHRGG